MIQPFYNDRAIREDLVDLRDQQYQPNLSILPNEYLLHESLLEQNDQGTQMLRFGVRNQGYTGRCAGFALANLVDIQRSLQFERSLPSQALDTASAQTLRSAHYAQIVSADMLYRMAYFHDRYPDLKEYDGNGPEGLRSLRSAIKGFYHHGVCFDWPTLTAPCPPGHWQSECYLPADALERQQHQLFPDVSQAKSARGISLGTYFRVSSILNHFHAALNETGAILVSAKVHPGWAAPYNHGNEGKIDWSIDTPRDGAHAFVIVGYDELGFHVLNSVGRIWGGYRNLAGIGLWSYSDWAQNIVDAWVLRLGVYAPEAFGASIGEKGVKGLHAVKGSTPCQELIGHYMHLDDGYHVRTGAYPSFPEQSRNTLKYLKSCMQAESTEKSDYKGVLLWIPGSLEGIKSAFSTAVRRKRQIKSLGLYPYTLFWCNGFAETSIEVLQGLFETCKAQAGEEAEHLDELIETHVSGIGRAIWRDIEQAARRAVAGLTELPQHVEGGNASSKEIGFVSNFLKELIAFSCETGSELHLVTEGAGVLVLEEFLSVLKSDKARPPEQRLFCTHDVEEIFSSVHLIAPAIDMPRAGENLIPMLGQMNKGSAEASLAFTDAETDAAEPFGNSSRDARANVYVPSPGIESQLRFGLYGKSLLRLVSRAFEDKFPIAAIAEGSADAKPRVFLGMADAPCSLGEADRLAFTSVEKVTPTPLRKGRIEQAEFDKNEYFHELIFEKILRGRNT